MTCSKAADVTHAAGATEFGQSHRPTQVSPPPPGRWGKRGGKAKLILDGRTDVELLPGNCLTLKIKAESSNC